MKKNIRLTESQLVSLIKKTIKRVLSEQSQIEKDIFNIKDEDDGVELDKQVNSMFAKISNQQIDYNTKNKYINDTISRYFVSPNVEVTELGSKGSVVGRKTIQEFLDELAMSGGKYFIKGGVYNNGKYSQINIVVY